MKRANKNQQLRNKLKKQPFKKLKTTILSGFLGSGKTTLVKNILENKEGKKICLIVNDMASINIDSAILKGTKMKQVQEELVEMQNGCICCTLRKDLLVEVRKLALEKKFDYLVIESTGISEPLQVAETFTFEDENGKALSDFAQLDTTITVVDLNEFKKNLNCVETLANRKEGVDEQDERTIYNLLVDQIEFADIIILNKCDLVNEEEIKKVEKIIRCFNPEAKIKKTTHSKVPINEVLGTGLFNFEKAQKSPMWLKAIDSGDEVVPETEEYGIVHFIYRRKKPFHPKKLFDFLSNTNTELFTGVYRSKGFIWISSKVEFMIEWAGVSTNVSVTPSEPWLNYVFKDKEFKKLPLPTRKQMQREKNKVVNEGLWDDEFGDCRQEIVFIGDKSLMRQTALIEELDSCLLTDEEMKLGIVEWFQFEDPFPDWFNDQECMLDDEEGSEEGGDSEGSEEGEGDSEEQDKSNEEEEN